MFQDFSFRFLLFLNPSSTVFKMFNVVLARVFKVYIIKTKLDFVSFNDKNLQRRRKFVGECDFPIQNSYSRFSHDVTKIQTKKLSILLSFMRYYST